MFKRLTLRSQLIASYLFLLGISLSVISFALLIFISSRPAPPEPVYQSIAALLQGLNARSDVQDTLQIVRGQMSSQLVMLLDDFAETNEVRILMLTLRDDRIQRIFYDSDEIYTNTTMMPMNVPVIQTVAYSNSRLDRTLDARFQTIFGRFSEPDDQWLFGGYQIEINPPRSSQPPTTIQLIIVEPEPAISIQTVIRDFSSSLLVPIIQAAMVGLLVAIVLSWLISRGIVRPLQNLARGAQAVARGDYTYQVPEQGALEVQVVAHAFNEMSKDVRHSQQAQRDFLANVSHDLKTPLTSIQGYAQAILDGAAKDPLHAANIIHDEAARLNRMVIELTDLMRMQSGRLSLNLTSIDVGEVTQTIGQRLSVVAMKKEIDLVLDTHPMPAVAADGDRIAQVLTNLISNAIKFTPRQGKITITTRIFEGGVQVSVADNGVGIPQADLPRIFERFYQVDKARGPQRGTGLGLAITREIIEAHNGTIHVHSDGENRGTTFTIWLPSPQLSTLITRQVKA